ncbi:hypothetical protein OPV22_020205 [Ensete ventricosum]|uniref:Uncharacterized protein n=1 Tax=Ensete ventricosum TaxID=4639 RepID=A0AAV8QI88_ENSVE|nr:hypothetical protein OPV22_020205 [Ensete ventricosum]
MWAPERSGPPEATTSATDPCPFGVILVISFSPAIKRSLPLLGNIFLTLFRPCGRRSRQKNTGGADRKPGYRRSPIVLFRHNTGVIGAPAEVFFGSRELMFFFLFPTLEASSNPRLRLEGCSLVASLGPSLPSPSARLSHPLRARWRSSRRPRSRKVCC